MAAKKPSVANEVRRIESRVRSNEGVLRIMLTVNDEKLRKAEQLRRLVREVMREPRAGVPAYAKWARAKERLYAFAAGLKQPFHNNRAQPKAVKAFIAKTGRRRSR